MLLPAVVLLVEEPLLLLLLLLEVMLLTDGAVEVYLCLVGLCGGEAGAGEGLEGGIWGVLRGSDDDAGCVGVAGDGVGVGVDGGGGEGVVGGGTGASGRLPVSTGDRWTGSG